MQNNNFNNNNNFNAEQRIIALEERIGYLSGVIQAMKNALLGNHNHNHTQMHAPHQYSNNRYSTTNPNYNPSYRRLSPQEHFAKIQQENNLNSIPEPQRPVSAKQHSQAAPQQTNEAESNSEQDNSTPPPQAAVAQKVRGPRINRVNKNNNSATLQDILNS